MKDGSVFLLIVLVLTLLFVGLVEAEDGPKGNTTLKDKSSNGVDLSVTKDAPPDFVKGDGEKKDKDQNGRSQPESTTNSAKVMENKSIEANYKALEKPKSPGDLSKENVDEGSDKKSLPIVDPQAAGCDPSNRCIDDKNKLVACLRVPGTDTQALSLLIQNKGNGPVDVKISAPSFVNLGQTKIQIKVKEDKEVTVYVVENIATDSMIVLKAGEGNCTLDFRNLIPTSIRKSEISAMSRFVSTSTRYALLCVCLAAAVITGMTWLCIRCCLLLRRVTNPKYRKLEVGLPVSTEEKVESDSGDDGWENSWGDGWGDDEAPMTPSKAISNPSLKGLASRRFNKDGWKD